MDFAPRDILQELLDRVESARDVASLSACSSGLLSGTEQRRRALRFARCAVPRIEAVACRPR